MPSTKKKIPLRVLLVEDNPDDAELVLRELRRHGFEPDWQRLDTEEEFLASLSPEVDIILSDYRMPSFDGLRALNLLKERDLKVPFILISGTVGEEVAVAAMRQGATDYLLKDRLARLGPSVAQALEQNQLRKQRRQAEQELRESAELNRGVLNSMTAHIAVLDRQSKIIAVNETWRQYAVECRAGRCNELLCTGLDADYLEVCRKSRGCKDALLACEGIQAVLVGARPSFSMEYSCHASGGQKWFWMSVTPLETSAGGAVVAHTDITERKLAEEARRKSEASLAAAQRIARLGSWELELETENLSWSAEMFALFGSDPAKDAPSLAQFAESIHDDDVERFDLSFAQAAVESSVQRLEFRYLHSDGGVRWIESVIEPVFDQNSKLMWMVGTMQDITERKQAGQQIREQADLLDHARDAILVRDLDDFIRFWNKGAERLYGWTAEEALGRKVNDLLYADTASFYEARETTIEEGFWSGELLHLGKDGREITVECRWTLVRDADESPKSILAINTDVTEKKKLEAQFYRAQRMESIGTLAGGIAHDLNNVLGPMIMAVDLLKLRITDPRDCELLELMETSGHRGADMVKQVLHFARGIESRRMLISPVKLVTELQRIVRDTFPKSISIEIDFPEKPWQVPGDRTQLHQVLLNLCINARDAMPDGGRLSIRVENLQIDEHYAAMHPEAQPGAYVAMEVTDTGTGMPPAVMEKIFEPFFTTKGIGKGTGLGLSTTLGIVKGHGGFLTVESKMGQGTTFRMHLPAEVESGEGQGETGPVELPRGHGETILLIDDEASIRSITGQTLEAFGYRVMSAADGAEGIAKYSQNANHIAAVITDMMMPAMDGASVIRVLMRLNPEVKIIAASGLSAKQEEAEAAGDAVKYFLPKPYTAETMLRVLRELLHPDEAGNYNPSKV